MSSEKKLKAKVLLTLAVVVPAASANLFRSPSFLNDVSHKAAVFRYK